MLQTLILQHFVQCRLGSVRSIGSYIPRYTKPEEILAGLSVVWSTSSKVWQFGQPIAIKGIITSNGNEGSWEIEQALLRMRERDAFAFDVSHEGKGRERESCSLRQIQ